MTLHKQQTVNRNIIYTDPTHNVRQEGHISQLAVWLTYISLVVLKLVIELSKAGTGTES